MSVKKALDLEEEVITSKKKVYLTPGDFIWDNYKRGERAMRDNEDKEMKDNLTKLFKDTSYNRDKGKSLEEFLKDHEGIHKEVRETINPIDHDLDNQEIIIRRRNIKTLKKNFNNLHKAVRNIKRSLEELL